MKLYKVDIVKCEVREIDGEPWPGSDSEGDKCFANTHFAVENAAWEKLNESVVAWVEVAARDVVRQRAQVLVYERNAADAAIAFERVRFSYAKFKERATNAENERLASAND